MCYWPICIISRSFSSFLYLILKPKVEFRISVEQYSVWLKDMYNNKFINWRIYFIDKSIFNCFSCSLYEIFPARTPMNGTEDFERLQEFLPNLKPGLGISAHTQAMNQGLTLLITIGVAIAGGIITGEVLL